MSADTHTHFKMLHFKNAVYFNQSQVLDESDVKSGQHRVFVQH